MSRWELGLGDGATLSSWVEGSLGFLSRAVLGHGHSSDPSLQMLSGKSGHSESSCDVQGLSPLRAGCGKAARICGNHIVPVPLRSHSEFSRSVWLAFRPYNDFKVLLVTAQNSPPQSVLETLRIEGRCPFFPTSEHPPYRFLIQA